jgi:tetratricopeptide (TPR) repeat protein
MNASPGLAALYAALAQLYFVTGRYIETLNSAVRAAELARETRDEAVLIQAEGRRAVALSMLGRHQEAVAALEGVIPLAEQAGDLDTLSRSLNNLGDDYFFGGDFSTGMAHYKRAESVAQRSGDPDHLAFHTAKVGLAALRMGDLRTAEQKAEQARGLARVVTSFWGAIVPLYLSGSYYRQNGQLDDATRSLEEALEIAQRSNDLQYLALVSGGLAECDLARGEPEAAIARLQPVLDLPGLPAHVFFQLATLAEAHLLARDVGRALSMSQRATVQAREHESLVVLVGVLRVEGMVLTEQRRWDEAEQAFAEAIDRAVAMPYPSGRARALYEQGIMLTRKGELERAGRCLDEALAIFRQLGARLDVERAEKARDDLR